MLLAAASDAPDVARAPAAGGSVDELYANFRDSTRFWIQRVAVPLLAIVGFLGNAVTIFIMTRRRMRSTTNLYLAALALVDMLYLLLTFLLGLSHYPQATKREYYVYWRVRPFLMMATDACSNTSVWLTVAFTIERFIAVKYPMRGKVWCTEERAKLFIAAVFAAGLVFSLPVPFEWQVVERPPPAGLALPQATLALDYSDFGRNETYKTVYYWSTALIFYFIPMLALMLFNGFLIKSVHASSKQRTQMTLHGAQKAAHLRKIKCRHKLVFFRAGSLRDTDKRTNGAHSAPVTSASAFAAELSAANEAAQRLASKTSVSSSKQLRFSIRNKLAASKSTSSPQQHTICSTENRANDASHQLASSPQLPAAATSAPPREHTFESLPRACRSFSSAPNAIISSNQSQERRITIMLIAVVILFLVCQIPSAAMILYSSVHEPEPNTNEHALVLAFGNIFNFLMAVNAAGNFVLYSFLSERYRRTFLIFFCKCFRAKQPQATRITLRPKLMTKLVDANTKISPPSSTTLATSTSASITTTTAAAATAAAAAAAASVASIAAHQTISFPALVAYDSSSDKCNV